MSQIQVDNIYNKEATGGPNFPLGANVTGDFGAPTSTGFTLTGHNVYNGTGYNYIYYAHA